MELSDNGLSEEEIAEIDRVLDAMPPTHWERLFDRELPETLVNGAKRMPDGTFGLRAGREDPKRSDAALLQTRLRIVERLLEKAQTGEPHAALRAVSALRRRLDELETDAVVLSRSCGWSWGQIARVLGKKRQTVHKRYA